MKKISRRKFIISSAKGATGLGIIAGCNKRSIVGDDIRPPSAPVGLNGYVEYEYNIKEAILTWKKHDYTDITGTLSEEEIKYNIYCEGKKLNSKPKTETTYTDDKGPDSKGLQEGLTYSYTVTAVDQNNNESPFSAPKDLEVNRPPSKIFKITRTDVITGNYKIQADIVKTMLHSAIMAMKDKTTVAEAYESFFPDLNVDTIIAVKINCLAGANQSTHPEVVEAIVDGLKQMLSGTFPLHNIIVFDDRSTSHMKSAGFVLKDVENDYKCVTTANNWGETTYDISGNPQKLSKIVEEADYIINVPVLKNHSQSGITFSLKNYFGIINILNNPKNLHNNKCDPYISCVYKLAAEKTKLIVGDAIFGAHIKGPDGPATFVPRSLLVATDPVAIDVCALNMINEVRDSKNMPIITMDKDGEARHITTSASDEYYLGTTNAKVIEI